MLLPPTVNLRCVIKDGVHQPEENGVMPFPGSTRGQHESQVLESNILTGCTASMYQVRKPFAVAINITTPVVCIMVALIGPGSRRFQSSGIRQ